MAFIIPKIKTLSFTISLLPFDKWIRVWNSKSYILYILSSKLIYVIFCQDLIVLKQWPKMTTFSYLLFFWYFLLALTLQSQNKSSLSYWIWGNLCCNISCHSLFYFLGETKLRKKCDGLNLIKRYITMLLRVMCDIVCLKCLIRNIYSPIGWHFWPLSTYCKN